MVSSARTFSRLSIFERVICKGLSFSPDGNTPIEDGFHQGNLFLWPKKTDGLTD